MSDTATKNTTTDHCSLSTVQTHFAKMSSQFPCGASTPVHLLGRPTFKFAPRYGILFKLSYYGTTVEHDVSDILRCIHSRQQYIPQLTAFAASSLVLNSTNANFPLVLT
jgi:hypothetical protein